MENKFENVKVGDTIYVIVKVVYGWGHSKCFTMPDEVIRVTKTRFVVKSGRSYTKRGVEIGKNAIDRAYYLGDLTYMGSIAKDESKEYMEFKDRLALIRTISYKLQDLQIKDNSKLTIEELESIESKLEDIIKLVNK